ncbi:MAG: uncharacterized protein JWP85_601 [Rhodoglobus sp.]|nr:uncharacterized protein [Rhodoglobus sp.]
MAFSAHTYSALADVSADFAPPPAAGLSDSDLLEAQRALAEIRRRVDASLAVVAGEVEHRSRPELGYDGLAQRLGARTPEKLVQQVTGVSAREAQSFVRVGVIMTTPALDPSADAAADAPADPTPWLRAVATAVTAGRLSIGAAEAIRAGLGAPDHEITADALDAAAAILLRDAASLTVERLAARARELRAELDLGRVLQRENALRERRYLHLTPQTDGMTRLSGLLDPESAALITSAFDAATSPRRGGPRFVEPVAAARAEALVRDERTTPQIAVDAFVELIRLGGAAGATSLIGGRRPAVQVLVTDRDLRARRGVGFIEGQTEPVSIETIERHVCEDGAVPILLDEGQVVNIGRESRRFTRIQKLGLAARDGGCIFPGCDRPPAWTEAHHINEWHRDHGRTDIADGVLLCRHHHMLVHNNDWRVTRDGSDYFLVPPRSHDPEQRPIPAPSKSVAMRRLVATG